MTLLEDRAERLAIVRSAVLEAIKGQSGLRARVVMSSLSVKGHVFDFREVDRALQALRKSKQIDYNSKTGWKAT